MTKTRKHVFAVLATLLFMTMPAMAQEEEAPNLETGNIEQQFNYILNESNNYKNYKVIRTTMLNTLRKNTMDSIARLEKELAGSRETTANQEKEIEGLKQELAQTNDNLAGVTEEKDSISFFGALINKPLYKSIMWGIVAVLTLVLLFFIYKFKNANAVTQEAKQSLAELELEYEEHRRKALEREQKARRQLQDEINKQKMQKSK